METKFKEKAHAQITVPRTSIKQDNLILSTSKGVCRDTSWITKDQIETLICKI
jgi:hypothetical protein